MKVSVNARMNYHSSLGMKKNASFDTDLNRTEFLVVVWEVEEVVLLVATALDVVPVEFEFVGGDAMVVEELLRLLTLVEHWLMLKLFTLLAILFALLLSGSAVADDDVVDVVEISFVSSVESVRVCRLWAANSVVG